MIPTEYRKTEGDHQPSTFSIVETKQLVDSSDSRLPFRLYAWVPSQPLKLPENLNDRSTARTFWGFIYEGSTLIETADNSYALKAGQYFSICDAITISGGGGFVVESIGYKGLNHIGGPIESSGRLKYLNGATDTLLISPVRKGEPCLNALYFAPNTNQVLHYHPSARIGMLVGGSGRYQNSVSSHAMVPGQMFYTRPNECHKFQSGPSEPMTLVIYHPDSSVGPTDEHHAMLEGTIVVVDVTA